MIPQKTLALLVGCLLAFTFSGCEEIDYTKNPYTAPPSTFEFSTTQDVAIKLTYRNIPTGYSVPFTIYSENPYQFDAEKEIYSLKSDIKSIGGGIAISGQYNYTKNLPSYVTDLYLYSPDIFVPCLMHAEVINGVAVFKEADLTSLFSSNPANIKTRSIYSWTTDYYLGQYGDKWDIDQYGRPNYIVDKSTVGNGLLKDIDANIMERISAAFPERVIADALYYKDAGVYLEKDAEVWVTLIADGAAYENSLSYYYYKGTKEDLDNVPKKSATSQEIKEIMAFPRAGLKDANGIQTGEYVQLKYQDESTGEWINTFPAGTTIGWILLSNGYNLALQNNGPYHRFYSTNSWNPKGTHATGEFYCYTTYFNAGTAADPFICFGFEDTTWGDKDGNDIMFHVVTNPVDAITIPPTIPDEENDVVTYDNRYGILAFEDQWPLIGDYDLNDVVVKYQSSTKLVKKADDNDAYAKEINDTFAIVHTGAEMNSKFSYKMNLTKADIKEIKITAPSSSYSDEADGKLIIEVCPNIREAIEPYTILTPEEYTMFYVNITLNEARISQTNLAGSEYSAPYNPFITPKEGIEVHLPFYKPTSKADLTQFGTKHDKSDLVNLFYVSGNDNIYPFAIHLSGADTFNIPEETKRIDATYPNYIKWVESNFQNYKDWYK